VAYLLKERIVEPQRETLLGNGSVTRNNGVTVGSGILYAVRANNDVKQRVEVGVRWPPACEDASPGAGERPLLEDVTKQRSEDRD
jgi:hypothetical protein